MGFIMCVFGHSIAQPGSASDCGLQQWPDRAPATDPKVPVKALKGGAQVHNLYVERHSSPGRVVVSIYNSTLNTSFLAVQDSSICDIVGRLVCRSQLTIRA